MKRLCLAVLLMIMSFALITCVSADLSEAEKSAIEDVKTLYDMMKDTGSFELSSDVLCFEYTHKDSPSNYATVIEYSLDNSDDTHEPNVAYFFWHEYLENGEMEKPKREDFTSDDAYLEVNQTYNRLISVKLRLAEWNILSTFREGENPIIDNSLIYYQLDKSAIEKEAGIESK